jgi:hypothetical protein
LDACYVVRDSNGQQLAYLYFEDERSRRIGGEVTKDEARRIAVNGEKRTGSIRVELLIPPS